MARMQTPSQIPEPGEPRRTLDRAPAERYLEQERRRAVAPPSQAAAIGRGAAVALAGAGVMTFAGGPLSVTFGLVAVGGFTAWLVASIVRPTVWVAVGLAVASVALGFVGIWLFAGLEGGTLGIVDYLSQVHGLIVPLSFAVAGLVAFGTIR